MAIEVHCDCGRVYSVGPELSGKKIRCKKCAIVLKVPVIPLGESMEAAPPSNEWEPVKEDAVICKTCGTPARPSDDVCLSCGAALGTGSGPIVPRVVLLGVLAAIALAVVGIVAVKLYSSSHLNGLLVTGREKLERGDVKAAHDAFAEVLKSNKESVPALEGLVQCGVTSSDWKLIRQYGPLLVAKLPKGEKRGRAKIELARAQVETGDFSSAEKNAREAKDDDPTVEATADEIVGLSLFGAKQTVKAEEALKKALESGSRDPRVAIYMARICSERGAHHDARVWADKAAEVAPKDEKTAETWLEIAALREKDGDGAGSLTALQTACDAAPRSGPARTKLALALLDAKRWPEALAVAKDAKGLSPDDALTARALGEALYQTNDWAGARAELERSEKLNADDAEATFLLGRALLRVKETDAGVSKLEKAIRKLEKDPSFAIDAGRTVLLVEGPPDKALAFLEGALRFEPREKEATVASRKQFAEARVLLARAAARLDRARQSAKIVDALNKAIDADPSRKDHWVDLAEHHVEQDSNPAKALAVLEKGLTFHPDEEELLYRAGVAAMKVGGKTYKNACEHLRKLYAKNPSYKDVKQKLEAAESGLQFEGGG